MNKAKKTKRQKASLDEVIGKIQKLRANPDFIRAAREFVRLTTS